MLMAACVRRHRRRPFPLRCQVPWFHHRGEASKDAGVPGQGHEAPGVRESVPPAEGSMMSWSFWARRTLIERGTMHQALVQQRRLLVQLQ